MGGTGTEEAGNTNPYELILYPNPCSERTHVSFALPVRSQLAITLVVVIMKRVMVMR